MVAPGITRPAPLIHAPGMRGIAARCMAGTPYAEVRWQVAGAPIAHVHDRELRNMYVVIAKRSRPLHGRE